MSKMRERGELRPEADPVALAHLLTAAFQGGALLDQAAGESAPCVTRCTEPWPTSNRSPRRAERAGTGRALTGESPLAVGVPST
ncbi:hypothetical protein ACRAWF_00445 [Streptomyces sp. L7]